MLVKKGRNMKKIEKFVKQYPVSKTLRFKAIPVGKTEENLSAKRILEEDEERAADYKQAKKIMDEYHRFFINEVLKEVKIDSLQEYATLYFKKNKDEKEKTEMMKMEERMRKLISSAFSSNRLYENLFKEKMISEVLPKFLTSSEDKAIISRFDKFYTIFSNGYNKVREHLYSAENRFGTVGYRLINENLPRFLNNVEGFLKIKAVLGEEKLREIEKNLPLEDYYLSDFFTIDFYNFVLTGESIDFYNSVLGGYSTEDGKIQGLNEAINLYNQQLGKSEKNKRLPLLVPLYKQVLATKTSFSYIQDGFTSDSEVLETIKDIAKDDSDVTKAVLECEKLFKELNKYDLSGIYVKNGIGLTSLSNQIYDSWAVIKDAWDREYDSAHKQPVKDVEKYEEKRRKEFNKIPAFSLQEICRLANDEDAEKLVSSISQSISELCTKISGNLNAIRPLLHAKYPEDMSLKSDEESIALIKNYLDAIKSFEAYIRSFSVSEKEVDIDSVFYGDFTQHMDTLKEIDTIYNAVRNYVTQKPYSKDKYSLSFQNPQFLGGWDKNKESDYRTTLLRKNGKFYLLIIDKSNSGILKSIETSEGEDTYEKLNYKLLPGPNKMLPKVFFSKKGLDSYTPPKDVLDIYRKETFKKGEHFVKSDCEKLISFYQTAISIHPEWSKEYDFHFRRPEEYIDISDFYRDVESQGYVLKFEPVSKTKIDELVENGSLYMFEIYSKDFSEFSHGKENLHTMYFKQIFEKNSDIKLCGGAEMFFRKASIPMDKQVIHRANEKIDNKNLKNPKHTSTFSYDIIKDRRYTIDQYELHLPITLNRCANDEYKLNEAVRKELRRDENPYIIGIDRGERNLLYVCVIDASGNIVEQRSLNVIDSSVDEVPCITDYHDLLDKREKARLSARQNWTQIENIKELKSGYLSQVIHQICELVEKYDAVIAMEDLNSGFKNSRVKVEKQVYQNFEKCLIEKMNYMTNKSTEIGLPGSVVNGYQLTKPFKSFKELGMQNGFIFYIPAWNTSKIDPATGFVNLLYTKYTNMEDAKEFIMSFDKISYNTTAGYFEFECDYSKFPRADVSYRKKWTICTYGRRIKTYRNVENNNEFDNVEVSLTDSFISLFREYDIDYSKEDIRLQICTQTEKDFYIALFELIRLTLQMRNSITGRTDVDYIISPIMGTNGTFYDSRMCPASLPQDADANGAYNIARKVLWVINGFKDVPEEDVMKTRIAISNKEWLEFAQKAQNGK